MFGDTPTVNHRRPDLRSRLSMRTRVTASVPPVRMRTLKSTSSTCLDIRLVDPEILAQRLVERVHRTVSFARVHHQLVTDLDLHDGLGDRHEIALRVVAALHQHAEPLHIEKVRHLPEGTARQKLEGCIGGFIGIALSLLRFHLLKKSLPSRGSSLSTSMPMRDNSARMFERPA